MLPDIGDERDDDDDDQYDLNNGGDECDGDRCGDDDDQFRVAGVGGLSDTTKYSFTDLSIRCLIVGFH